MAGISGPCTPGCTADTGLSCCHDRHGVDEDGGDDDEIGSIGKNDDCFFRCASISCADDRI